MSSLHFIALLVLGFAVIVSKIFWIIYSVILYDNEFDTVINITFILHSPLSLLIKVLVLLFIRHYLSKASQAPQLGLNYFCIILSGFN